MLWTLLLLQFEVYPSPQNEYLHQYWHLPVTHGDYILGLQKQCFKLED